MNNNQLFDKEIREKLYHYSVPGETGHWEDLTLRMAGRHALKRRRRWMVPAAVAVAAAAVLLLFLFVFVPFTGRLSSLPLHTCKIITPPVGIDVLLAKKDIPHMYSHARLDLLRKASKVPAVSEVGRIQLLAPVPKPVIADPKQVATELWPAVTELRTAAAELAAAELTAAELAAAELAAAELAAAELAAAELAATELELAAAELAADKEKAARALKTQGQDFAGFFPEHPSKVSRINQKWITAANFSYQGAINGTYLFTPSTYTTKWETPLSLAASDLSNLGIPDYMAPQFDEDDMNRISAHFSTPMSAGINVQKEINKWLSVGFSLTYTLLRGEYQVHTADKSYIVNQNTHYIGIPVGVYLRAVNTRSLTVYAVGGGAVDRAVADEYMCRLNDVATRQFSPVSGFQWSLYGGLGIEYKWSELMGIYIEPSVSHYFDNNQPKSIRTIQPTQFKMEVGIRFRI